MYLRNCYILFWLSKFVNNFTPLCGYHQMFVNSVTSLKERIGLGGKRITPTTLS